VDDKPVDTESSGPRTVVRVKGGIHTVTFQYVDQAARVGAAVSCFSWAMVGFGALAVWFRGRMRRRHIAPV
jgi:hypothetical protein